MKLYRLTRTSQFWKKVDKIRTRTLPAGEILLKTDLFYEQYPNWHQFFVLATLEQVWLGPRTMKAMIDQSRIEIIETVSSL